MDELRPFVCDFGPGHQHAKKPGLCFICTQHFHFGNAPFRHEPGIVCSQRLRSIHWPGRPHLECHRPGKHDHPFACNATIPTQICMQPHNLFFLTPLTPLLQAFVCTLVVILFIPSPLSNIVLISTHQQYCQDFLNSIYQDGILMAGGEGALSWDSRMGASGGPSDSALTDTLINTLIHT